MGQDISPGTGVVAIEVQLLSGLSVILNDALFVGVLDVVVGMTHGGSW